MADWDKLNSEQRVEVLRSDVRSLARSVERLEQHHQANQLQAMRMTRKMDDIIATLARLAEHLGQP
jgi:hypothetical protein